MKELKIPHKQREHFKKSFLHNTSLLLFLNQDFKMESSIEYLKGKKWEIALEEQQMNVFRKDACSILCMKTLIIATISTPSYKNFDDIKDIATDITAMLESNKIETIKEMHLTKENRYKLRHEQNKGKKWLIKTLFSDDFSKEFPINEGIFIFKTPEYLNTISLKQEQRSDDIDSLIFRIFTSTDKAVKTKHWYEKAKTMNENIYDVWRWAVSDNVITMMNK